LAPITLGLLVLGLILLAIMSPAGRKQPHAALWKYAVLTPPLPSGRRWRSCCRS